MRPVFVVRFVNSLEVGGESSTLVTTPLVCESRSDAEDIVAMYGNNADVFEVPFIPKEGIDPSNFFTAEELKNAKEDQR